MTTVSYPFVSILTLYELYYSIERAKEKNIESEVIALKPDIL
jgi:hypothetical protein